MKMLVSISFKGLVDLPHPLLDDLALDVLPVPTNIFEGLRGDPLRRLAPLLFRGAHDILFHRLSHDRAHRTLPSVSDLLQPPVLRRIEQDLYSLLKGHGDT